MKIISLQQGSAEWLDWRKTKITATDASSIMGLNEFKDVKTLWREKLDMVAAPPANERMLRGQKLEPEARALFIEEMGINVEPLVVESEEFYWMGASLDGIDDSRKIIIEIKCPSVDSHTLAIAGGIRPSYKAQMQHQLCTAEAEICYYVSYNPSYDPYLNIIEVYRDDAFIEEMIEKERYFFEQCICRNEEPMGDWKL